MNVQANGGRTNRDENDVDRDGGRRQVDGSHDNEESNTTTTTTTRSVTSVTNMSLNATKAGMEGLDTERINAIIQEASKGSKFYRNKEKNQNRIDLQVQQMLRCKASLGNAQVATAERHMDCLAAEMAADVDWTRTLVHVDMDAFYASVHEKDEPSLRDKPMAVGSLSMLSTSNYRARRYGVRAAMPGFIALKLCPGLILVPPDFSKYKRIAQTVRTVFAKYDANFSAASLDEAYLDLTAHLRSSSSGGRTAAWEVVRQMREEIRSATGGLTASAGIAPNTLMAKVCSDHRKPDGQFQLGDEEDVIAFVRDLPVRKMGGIGNVTEQLLAKVLDVKTCGQLFQRRGLVRLLFGSATAHFLLRASMGLGSDRLATGEPERRKSLSTETTFVPTNDAKRLAEICERLCLEVSGSLRDERLTGKSLTLKIKTDHFEVRTKACQLSGGATDDPERIKSAALKTLTNLLSSEKPSPTLRLMGVRMSDWAEVRGGGGGGHAKIDAFINRQRPVLPTFGCPVCGNRIESTSETSFNRHLDRCLANAEEEEEERDPPFESANSVETDPSVSAEVPDKTKLRTLNAFRCPVCDNLVKVDDEAAFNDHLDDCLKCERPIIGKEPTTTTTKASSSAVVCPVCDRKLSSDGGERSINRHVNECLLTRKRKETPEPSPSEKQKQGKKKKRTQLSNSILNYLTT